MASAPPPATRRPRSRTLRTLLAALIMVGFLGIPFVLRQIVPGVLGDYVAALPVLLSGVVIAPRVSYRWFDCFMLLIPIFGIALAWRFAWRLGYLPYRDWPPRTDESPRLQQVNHPDAPGAPLYLPAKKASDD